jgi:hypothetical protein
MMGDGIGATVSAVSDQPLRTSHSTNFTVIDPEFDRHPFESIP